MAEKPLTVLKRGTSKPFSHSKCTSYQVLNFGNNILHFSVGACCRSCGFTVCVAVGETIKSWLPFHVGRCHISGLQAGLTGGYIKG